jgi:hypothetical protein
MHELESERIGRHFALSMFFAEPRRRSGTFGARVRGAALGWGQASEDNVDVVLAFWTVGTVDFEDLEEG